ncbi:GspE/PulE family protein [Selenomonas sp. CM52]|uniref:GspE/PulE family protein n=1 Tax=Selenomonas sp. CM52 TaxID=936381 RepID=UPI00027C63DF|nr:GspE/PulE family protein [Selenomonas sp. CM52]EJU28162.1 type II/IV secretion system protein [Selenomonas sp. CM52]
MQRTEEDSYQRLIHRLVQSVRTGSASRALPRQGEPGRVPVVEFVDRMIAEALRLRASDIHIEPFEGAVRIRYRVDGSLLETHAPIPREVHAFLLARLKVMAHLESVERRMAQDGRISYVPPEGGEAVDLRLATLPLLAGEKAVLRILNRSHALLSVGNLGFSVHNETLFRRLCHQPGGMVLITGPVNSGKTTTLYAALSEINTPERNIMTIEDPPEYRIEGVNQIQVNKKTGMTYAAGLRAMLRSDIDEIVLGEIRDAETAEMAVRAALTGHLLFSTLHTKDALGAVFRLLDMGVPAYLLAAALTGVVAQRLVRRLCPHCREPSEEALPAWAEGVSSTGRLWRAAGCAACGGTGFSGRLALQELLVVDAALQQAVVHRAGLEEMRELARRQGMRTLAEDGIEKALQGQTTLSEVVRVLYGEADAADFSGTFSGAARGDCGGVDDGGV